MTQIHPSAVVDLRAQLDEGVEVGPYAVVGPDVTIGAETTIGAHVVIERNTRLGRRCYVGTGTVLGSPPQDRRYDGEPTWLEVGDETQIREHATLNRGTTARGVTRVGRRCYLMSYVHVAHDCTLEDEVTLANGVQLAGHVRVEHGASISGLTPVHQFVRIGTLAFVGGASRVSQDVPPYARASGNPCKLYGINTIGLTRAGLSTATCQTLKHAYRLLFNSDLTVTEAVELLRARAPDVPELAHLLDFVSGTERGVLV